MANPSGSSVSYQDNLPYIQTPPSLNEISSQRSHHCGVCSASFRRREHFERHLKSHLKAKEFRCDVCHKQFARRDTLQRHSTVHGQTPTKVQKTRPRASRACLNCVKSKQRCSGSHPCDRCDRKGWSCHFSRGLTEVAVQDPEILSDSNNGMASRGIRRYSRHGHPSEASDTSIARVSSPVSTVHANPSGSDSAQNAGESFADLPFSNHDLRIPQYGEPASIFESYLLWPLDDPFEHTNMPSIDPSCLSTPSGMTGTANQPIGMSHAMPVQLQDFQQEFSGQADDTPITLNGQASKDLSEDNLSQDDRDILISEDYGHVPRPSLSLYEQIRGHYAEVTRCLPEAGLPALYSLDILHVCTQLYFEHFHQLFPILHKGTFEASGPSWLLYLVVAAVGSQYSRLAGRSKIFFDLVKATRVSLLQKLSSNASLQSNLELAQATLLFNLALLFGGRRDNVMHLQYQRNLLLTMCRPLLVHGILFAKGGTSDTDTASGSWTGWIATESWKRLVYFAWLMESFQLVLLDLPPLISVDEMHPSMPCNDELWQSASFHEWERAKGLQRGPEEHLSVACLLKKKVIDQELIHSLSDSALWISTCAVYVTERHSTSQQLSYSISGIHCIPLLGGQSSSEEIVPADRDNDSGDALLEAFQQTAAGRRKDSLICPTITKFSLLLRLLRFIKYRFLYVSSGWMVQYQEVEAAAQHIKQLLHTNPRQARQSLLHAAQLFRIIRSQHQFDPYDSFFLLMVALYIWNYDRFVLSDISHAHAKGVDQEIIRIDQNLKNDLRDQWIAGTIEPPRLVHISGLGVLNGQDSVPRVFRESVRILSHEKAWSEHAHAIKYSLLQILSGINPSFPAEAG